MTFTYNAAIRADLRNGARVDAISALRGHAVVVATGRVVNHQVRLTFPHLKHGRYRFTLYELGAGHARTTLGRSMIAIS